MVESTYTFIVWAYLVRAKIIYIDATFCGWQIWHKHSAVTTPSYQTFSSASVVHPPRMYAQGIKGLAKVTFELQLIYYMEAVVSWFVM